MIKHAWVIVGGSVAALVLAAGCGRSVSGEGTIRTQGDVTVVRAGSTVAVPVKQGDHLGTGDLVDVVVGSATVNLSAGGRLELRTGSVVRFAGGPQLRSGDLLVDSPKTSVPVETSIASVDVTGIAKLHRDLALSVGTYSGKAVIVSTRTVTVPRLREDTVASVGFAPDPLPLQLDANDRWDERYLGVAIDLTNQLDSQAGYLTANIPAGEPVTAAFYRQDLQPLAAETGFTDALLTSVSAAPSPGDAVIAASIALAGNGAFVDRFHAAFTLRQQGGQWGIVALDQAADTDKLLGLVGTAVDQAGHRILGKSQVVSLNTSAPSGGGSSLVATSSTPTTGAPETTPTSRPHGGPTPPPTTQPPPGGVPTTVPKTPPVTVPTPTPNKQPVPTAPPATVPPNANVVAPVVDPVVSIIHSLLPGKS